MLTVVRRCGKRGRTIFRAVPQRCFSSTWVVLAAFFLIVVVALLGILELNRRADNARRAQLTLVLADGVIQGEQHFGLAALGRGRIDPEIADGLSGTRDKLSDLMATLRGIYDAGKFSALSAGVAR